MLRAPVGSYKLYMFTEEEKLRIQRRRKDSQTVRKCIDMWYKGLCLFPYRVCRSVQADYGPLKNCVNAFTNSNKPVTDCTIIKYGLYSDLNKSILDMFKLGDSTLRVMLQILYDRLKIYFREGSFRIKAVRKTDLCDRIQEDSYIQIIFVESCDKYCTVRGDKISIITVREDSLDNLNIDKLFS